ncbi:MAG: SMP-30/gluconolactonase/LRE family protein [Acidimicrobiia bacterium]
MNVERLTEPGAVLGEGPLWDVVREDLLWVDILGKKIHRTDVSSGWTESIETPMAVGAVGLDESGDLLASLVDGVYRRDDEGKWARMVEIEAEIEGNRANDSKTDPFGNYLVGTMSWDGDSPTAGLYRVSPDASVETLRTGLTISNGMDWVDGALWHIDTPTGQVVGFRYDPDGPLGDHVGVVEVDRGSPDGMTADAEGCLWVARWGTGTVARYDLTGRVLAEISLPASHVSSCAFVGPALDTLAITTATQGLDDPTSQPEAGAVFIVDPGVTGREPFRFGRKVESGA